MHLEHVHVFDEVPERVIDQSADEFRARGQARMSLRIDLQLVDLAGITGTLCAEPGLEAPWPLALHDRPGVPFACLDRVELVGAADDFPHRHRPYADAIGEPTGVGDFVHGVDIDRALCRPVSR